MSAIEISESSQFQLQNLVIPYGHLLYDYLSLAQQKSVFITSFAEFWDVLHPKYQAKLYAIIAQSG